MLSKVPTPPEVEWTSPTFGCQTTLATVLHMLVEVSKREHGSVWPQHVAVLDASSEQRMQILPLHPTADLVCAILQLSSHYDGGLFLRRSDCLIMDGGVSVQAIGS